MSLFNNLYTPKKRILQRELKVEVNGLHRKYSDMENQDHRVKIPRQIRALYRRSTSLDWAVIA
jgi:hypothetical protein